MSEKLADSVLAAAAHELLSPLTAIRGYTETLMKSGRENLSEKQKEHLNIVLGSCDRLQDFIEDLLELSRLDNRSFESFPQRVDLAPFLEDWWKKESRPPFPAVLNKEEKLPQVWADETRLKQILHRLYRHSLEHVPPDGRLEIAVREEGEKVSFRFLEVGAEAESGLEDLFKRFASSPLKRTHRGVRQGSLALAFCREAAGAFGAELAASKTSEGIALSLTCKIQKP